MKVAFICVHNSCRSQIAEALCKTYRKDIICYSAGTEIKKEINPTVIRIMKKVYNIDMKDQYPKLISDIPLCDKYISMGCHVECPFIEKSYDDNFNIEDPTGKSDDEYIKVIEEIKQKILKL